MIRWGGNEAFEAIGGEGRDSKEVGQNYICMLHLQVAELSLGIPGMSAKYITYFNLLLYSFRINVDLT